MTGIRLVALDLDGTTLNSQHELSDRTIAVLRRLSKAGVVICIATGRSTSSILRYLDVLKLAQDVTPAISYNGAYGMTISNTGKPSTVFHDPLPQQSTHKLLEFAAKRELVVQYYNSEKGEVFAVPKNEDHHRLLGKYASLVSRPQVFIKSYDEAVALSPASKILIMTSDADEVLAEAQQIFSAHEFHFIRGSPDPFFVEFLRPGVCKGSGLQKLCNKLGVDMSNVAAFGDGDNDQEMLHLAGVGVAMKNAKDAAKNAANVVLEWTNDEDGVALELERMEANGHFSLQN